MVLKLPLMSPLMSSSSIDGEMEYVDHSVFNSSLSCSKRSLGPQSVGSTASDQLDGNAYRTLLESLEGEQVEDLSDPPSNLDMFKTLLESLHGRLLLMEENVTHLRSEIQHKNTTIEQLFKVINKQTHSTDADTTYNKRVDIYNENVSNYNSTPVNNENVTTRKKRNPPQELSEYDFQDIHSEENNITTDTVEDPESKVSVAEQLEIYKTVKHSNFLSLKEGMVWDGSSWKKKEHETTLNDHEPTHDVCSADVPLQNAPYHLDDDHDVERMNNLYEDWGDMSILSDGGQNIAQLSHLYKQPLPIEAQWKKGTTLIIGDSMLGGIDETRLRNTKVRSHPGALIEDMFFQITPYLRKRPSNIICHIGTNNAKSDNADVIMEKLVKLKEYIMAWCPSAKIVFSSLILRRDDKHAAKVVDETNQKLKHLDTPLLDNGNITEDFLGRRGLHLNYSGTKRLAMNLIKVLRDFNN